MKTNPASRWATFILAVLTSTTLMAQDKLFTLEDLNYGGKNYRNMTPQTKYYTWWGDILVSTEREGSRPSSPLPTSIAISLRKSRSTDSTTPSSPTPTPPS